MSSTINTINSQSLLLQMRLMAARAEGLPDARAVSTGLEGVKSPGAVTGAGHNFTELLASKLSEVNQLQKTSSELATRFEQGDPAVDVAEVMVAMQRSSVGFTAVTQVRNRLIAAYQEIMNMPV